MAVLYTFIVVLMCMFVKGNDGGKKKKSVQKYTDSGVKYADLDLMYHGTLNAPNNILLMVRVQKM